MCKVNDHAVVYASSIATPAVQHRSSALIDHLARFTRARAESALDRQGLRPRALVALTLLRDHGSFSQQGLATALQIDKTNLVGLLNDLEHGGLVERRRSPEDRRRHVVAITPAGEAKLADAEAALAAVEDDLLRGLSEDERETLYQLLQRATSEHVVNCSTAKQAWVEGSEA